MPGFLPIVPHGLAAGGRKPAVKAALAGVRVARAPVCAGHSRNSGMRPFWVAVMIAKTFFLAKDSHRISPLSLREELSLRDHDDGRCPAYLIYGTNALRVPTAGGSPVSPASAIKELSCAYKVTGLPRKSISTRGTGEFQIQDAESCRNC